MAVGNGCEWGRPEFVKPPLVRNLPVENPAEGLNGEVDRQAAGIKRGPCRVRAAKNGVGFTTIIPQGKRLGGVSGFVVGCRETQINSSPANRVSIDETTGQNQRMNYHTPFDEDYQPYDSAILPRPPQRRQGR